jgi:hypothetical protein
MKPFVTEVLDASDNYIQGDENGNDSLTTIVYVTLDDSPEMKNQIVDFKIHLDFLDGMVILRARDFIYRGRKKSDGIEVNTPLYKLEGLSDSAKSWAMIAFDETLRLVMAQMDKHIVKD